MIRHHPLLLGMAIAPVLAGLLLLGLQVANAGVVARGVALGELPLGGLSQQEAEALVKERAKRFLTTPMSVMVEGNSFSATPEELGVTIDATATAQQAFSIGRNAFLFRGIGEQVKSITTKKHMGAAVAMNETRFLEKTAELFSDLEKPARNAAPLWDGTFVGVLTEEAGLSVSRANMREAVLAAASVFSQAALAFPLETEQPVIFAHETEEAQNEVAFWFDALPVTLEAAGTSVAFAAEDLAELAAFKKQSDGRVVAGVNPATAKNWLETNVGARIRRPPQDARFEIKGARVVTFVPSHNGIALDYQKALSAVEEGLAAREKRIALAVIETEPHIKTQDANDLGIVALLGRGESDFAGSPKNRIYNIRVGASRFNGILIPPGEEFSFNKELGPVTEEAGYKAELVILQGKTSPQLGGGLCQVSTTAFRAAIFSGLEITQRRSHSYVVRYYGAPGFDATIYPPNPDLRFRNDTAGHILIQTSVQGTKLIFEFYGSPDERIVEVEGPRVFDQRADGSAKAVLSVHTSFPSGETREQTFHSTYKSPTLYPVSRRNPLE